MRLTMQDKNELLKAALKADDLGDLKLWLVAIVDAADAPSADGKQNEAVSVPPFQAHPANPEPMPPLPVSQQYPTWGEGALPVRDNSRRDR